MSIESGAVLNWLLSIVTIGVVGVLAMNVQLWRLHERMKGLAEHLKGHEDGCLLKHNEHTRRIEQLWDFIHRTREVSE